MKVGEVYTAVCPSHKDWGAVDIEVLGSVGNDFVVVRHGYPTTKGVHIFNAEGFEVGPIAYDQAFEIVGLSKAEPLYAKRPAKKVSVEKKAAPKEVSKPKVAEPKKVSKKRGRSKSAAARS